MTRANNLNQQSLLNCVKNLVFSKPRATTYYPTSDGQAERLNRTLIEMLSKYAEENHHRWDNHLPLVLLAYNSSVHDSTSLSPAMMTYATDLGLPADLIFEGPEHASKQAFPPSEYVRNLAEQMEKSP